MRGKRFESFPIALVAWFTAVKKLEVPNYVLRIFVPNIKLEPDLSLQQGWSPVRINMSLPDNNDALAKPILAVVFGEGLKLPSAPSARHPIRRKDNEHERGLFQGLLDLRRELIAG
jgi:hypothetical protein